MESTKTIQPTVQYKTDTDVLREEYRFIRTEEDDESNSWEKQLSKKYYEKLFKEYCLADMSLYKEGKVGMRWRTQDEVFKGKGQFICGNKKCDNKDDLKSYEVNFSYLEAEQKKNALVKLRTCPDCSIKLNYKQIKKERKAKKKEEQQLQKKRKLLAIEASTEAPQEKNTKEETAIELTPEQTQELSKEEEPSQESIKESMKKKESNAWKQKPEIEKTKEDEYDEYFHGLFL